MKEEIEKIDRVIKTLQYPYFRLLDENRIVIVPPKRPGSKNASEYLQHWAFVKHKLYNELPTGKYILECFYDVGRKTHYDYEIIKDDTAVQEPIILQNNFSDKKNQETVMTEDKIFELVRECEQLKAEKSVLMMEVKMLQEKYAQLESELEDAEGLADEANHGISGGMSAMMPTITPMLEKYFAQRDRELAIMEARLNKTKQKPKIKIHRLALQNQQQQEQQPQQQEQQPQQQEQLTEYEMLFQQLDNLLNTDPETANMQLDAIQDTRPDVYAQLVIDLNLEHDGQ